MFLSKLFGRKRPSLPPDRPAARGGPPVSPTARKLHDVITAMCASPAPSFEKQRHAAPLYELLPRSHVARDVADLFVEATTYTAAFTGVRHTESMGALEKLCRIATPVVDNLLHCIARMGEAALTTAIVDARGPDIHEAKSTVPVSFEAQRTMARQEIRRRGSPPYDVRHYYDVPGHIVEIEMLGQSREPGAPERLLAAFRARGGREKRAAIQALATIGDPAAARCLHEIFAAADDVKTRRAALRSLAGCEMDDAHMPSLAATMIACLGDEDGTVRETALRWLKDRPHVWRSTDPVEPIGDTRRKLLSMLQQTDPNAVYHAVDSLGEMGLAEDVAALEKCARRVKPAAVPRVKQAIKRITDRAT